MASNNKTSIETAKTARTVAIVTVILGVILIVTAVILLAIDATNNDTSTPPADDDNNSVIDDETSIYKVFTSVDSQGVLDFLAQGNTGFLYAGRPTCPNCSVFAPLLSEVAKEHDFTVYYYDTEIANNNADLKTEALTAIDVTGVPAFMFIKDGQIVEKLTDRSTTDSILAFFNKYN